MADESRELRLQSLLHSYLQALDRGEQPDRQAILAAHPDLADELAEYFTDASRLEQMAQSLRTASFNAGKSGTSPSLGKVRYFGDYELLEELAHGGMGVVFKARQVSLNRTVALKMILKGELASSADVRRFQQEAEAAANLDHPHIVPIYEVGEHEGQQYFSMKLIEPGQRKEGARGAAETLAKVARAVHHAHQRRILHRDLKPSNILIDQNGEPHVADFGLAKKVEGGEQATQSGAIVGTPAYMAPEQARAEKSLTTAVDVYSLGGVLYTWLTGQPPFRGEDPLATLIKVTTDEPFAPRKIDPTIDRDLETICLKCLQKEPGQRYGSADAVAEELERWLRGEPISARPAGMWERTWRWCRRNPVGTGLSAALVALAISLGAGLVLLAVNRQVSEAHDEAIVSRDRAIVAEAGSAAALERERQALTLAEQRKLQAEDARGLAEAQRARLHVATATRLTDEGDLLGALPWLVEALRTDGADPAHARVHRLRLAATLQQCPRLLLEWTPPQGQVPVFSPNGRHALVFSSPLKKEQQRPNEDGEGLALMPGLALKEGPQAALQVAVWDMLDNRQLVAPLAVKQHVLDEHSLFTPDGQRFLTVEDHPDGWRVVLRDVLTGKPAAPIIRPSLPVQRARLSPDGILISTVSAAQNVDQKYEVHLWDVATGRDAVKPLLFNEFVQDAGFPAEGRVVTVASGGRKFVQQWAEDGNSGVTYEVDELICQCWDTATGQKFGEPMVQSHYPFRGAHFTYTPDTRWMFRSTGGRPFSGTVGVVEVWDILKGKQAVPAYKPSDYIDHLDLGPEGSLVLVAGGRSSLWRWRTEKEPAFWTVKDWPGDRNIKARFGPDGRFGLTTKKPAQGRSDLERSQLWDLSLGRAITPLLPHDAGGVRFAPDGRRLITSLRGPGKESSVRIWDTVTTEPSQPLSGKSGQQNGWLSPDGQLITILLSPPPEEVQAERVRQALIIALSSTPLCSVAALPALQPPPRPSVLQVREVLTAKNVSPPLPAAALLDSAAAVLLNATKTHLVCLGNTRLTRQKIQIWDIASGKQLGPTWQHDNGTFFQGASLSTDGRRLVTAVLGNESSVSKQQGKKAAPMKTFGVLRLWDTATGQEMANLVEGRGVVQGFAMSPDGRRVVAIVSDDAAGQATWAELRTWDAATGQALESIPIPGPITRRLSFGQGELLANRFLVFHPKENRVAFTLGGNEAYLADLNAGSIRPLMPRHNALVNFVAFSPDGRRVVALDAEGTARAWDGTSAEPVTPPLPLSPPVINNLIRGLADMFIHDGQACFSGDGRFLATAVGQIARVWDLQTGEPITPPVVFPRRPNYVEFGPGDRGLLTTSGQFMMAPLTRWPLPHDMLPEEDLGQLAYLLAGQRIDHTGTSVPIEPVQRLTTWQALRARYPNYFTLPEAELRAWHQRLAQSGEDTPSALVAAVFHLGELIRRSPQDASLRVRRADACAVLGWQERAAADYAQALKLDPGNANTWEKAGLAHAAAGQHAPAAAAFSEVIRFRSEHAGAWFRRSLARSALREWQPAVTDLTRATELDPKNWEVWYHLSLARYEVGDKEQAAADFGTAASLAPTSRYGHHKELEERFTLAEWQKIALRDVLTRRIAKFAKFPDMDPDHSTYFEHVAYAHCRRAKLEQELGRWEQAEHDYAQAVKLHPENRLLWLAWVEARTHLKRGGPTAEEFAHTVPPGRGSVKHMVVPMKQRVEVVLHLYLGEAERARQICERKKGWNSDTDEARTKSLLKLPAQMAAEAVKAGERAVKNNPNDSRNLAALGAVLYRAERYQEAREQLERAWKLQTVRPDSYTALFLAMTHHHLGDTKQARDWLERAVQSLPPRANEPVSPDEDGSDWWHMWQGRLELQQLRREVESLLGAARATRAK